MNDKPIRPGRPANQAGHLYRTIGVSGTQDEIDAVLELTPRQRLEAMLAALADLDNMTICDRCGDEIPQDEANYAGPELPLWEGATLCNECYAAERVSEPQPADPDWGLDETPND